MFGYIIRRILATIPVMVKLTPKRTAKGGIRIVENLTFMPVTKEVVEEPVMVEAFQQQLAPGGLYKIWANDPLPPGEYAIVLYTDGKVDIQSFDFAIKAK